VTEVLAALETQARRDSPDVIISDDNTSVPTALFCRRAAPVQIFLQHGCPAWPVRQLEAVFNSFGIDPAIAGWGGAAMLACNMPWDLAALNPELDAAELERERQALPRARFLIGCYGRLVKVTVPYLRAVERVLMRCPGTVFVTGGTGEAAEIRAFAKGSPVGDRMHVEARFVPGHVWGQLLDVFLDTWPITGGESCRQVIARGRPVVGIDSVEMPALRKQRDPLLVAEDWDGFVERTVSCCTT
jgi:hypothetical protein